MRNFTLFAGNLMLLHTHHLANPENGILVCCITKHINVQVLRVQPHPHTIWMLWTVSNFHFLELTEPAKWFQKCMQAAASPTAEAAKLSQQHRETRNASWNLHFVVQHNVFHHTIHMSLGVVGLSELFSAGMLARHHFAAHTCPAIAPWAPLPHPASRARTPSLPEHNRTPVRAQRHAVQG